MLTRRQLIQASAGSLALASASPLVAQPTQRFDFADVIERAQQLALRPFADPSGSVPASWQQLSYDQHRKIRFNRKKALWHDRGLFQIQFFHPGFLFTYPVQINIIDNVGGQTTPMAYDPELFDFDDLQLKGGDGRAGYAGFRVHYPLNRGSKFDEFAVFLGASYFRLIGRDQIYGLSARGLAVNTANPGGEEFPIFREFWLQRGDDDDTSVTVYALLDSASVSGAYRFILRPRTATQADVSATLFPRVAIDKLGIAPLTSMFMFGEDRSRNFDDFRPEVHDSDGLMIHAGTGEWLWRPLVNRQQLQVSSLLTENPRGFGLIQRDRDFNNYQDLESQYHRRPSLWVQPMGDWGSGRIELVEIPSPEETNDNIVSYWVSDQPVKAGQRLDYRYLLNAYLDHQGRPPGGRVESTRLGSATRPGAEPSRVQPASARLVVIDFNQGDLPLLAADQPVEAVVTSSSGRLGPAIAQKNTVTGGWRAFFDFFPNDREPADLRCYLRIRRSILTETWNYLWTPSD